MLSVMSVMTELRLSDEAASHYVVQVDLNLLFLLPLPPKCSNCGHTPPYPG